MLSSLLVLLTPAATGVTPSQQWGVVQEGLNGTAHTRRGAALFLTTAVEMAFLGRIGSRVVEQVLLLLLELLPLLPAPMGVVPAVPPVGVVAQWCME